MIITIILVKLNRLRMLFYYVSTVLTVCPSSSMWWWWLTHHCFVFFIHWNSPIVFANSYRWTCWRPWFPSTPDEWRWRTNRLMSWSSLGGGLNHGNKEVGRVPSLPPIRPQPISPALPEAQQWSDQPPNSLLPFYTAVKPTFRCRFSWDLSFVPLALC